MPVDILTVFAGVGPRRRSREAFDRQLALLRSRPITAELMHRAGAFLPPQDIDGPPDAAFVIFANDGRGYDPIVIDLQASRTWDIQACLAHEFHHWYRNRRLVFNFASVDSLDQDLISTLDQLQSEGIADQIDKRGWILGETDAPANLESYAERYIKNLSSSLGLLRSVNSLMALYQEEDDARGMIGAEINRLVPQSGHPTGFFMASLIMEQLGPDALIADVGNPFAFVRTFNVAANMAGETEPIFSSESVGLMTRLERRYAKH